MAEKKWGDLLKDAASLSIDFAEKGISTLRRIPPLAKEVAQQPKKPKKTQAQSRKKTQGQKTRTQQSRKKTQGQKTRTQGQKTRIQRRKR